MADRVGHGIEIKHLYKIFGEKAAGLVDAVKGGMSKTALMEQHSHVLGLKDINISMPGGCIQVIMGLSGSGKSTLIRHINRLIDPTVGEVLVDGVDVVKMNKADLHAVPPPPDCNGLPEVRAFAASDGARQHSLRP